MLIIKYRNKSRMNRKKFISETVIYFKKELHFGADNGYIYVFKQFKQLRTEYMLKKLDFEFALLFKVFLKKSDEEILINASSWIFPSLNI